MSARKEKYVLQTYKERRKVYPYEETTAYYFGPKLDFTKTIKTKKKNVKKN
tara:strand:- start:585 stop:737 length:153 start_codon:yes stop_codon:yes gene_type:complete